MMDVLWTYCPLRKRDHMNLICRSVTTHPVILPNYPSLLDSPGRRGWRALAELCQGPRWTDQRGDELAHVAPLSRWGDLLVTGDSSAPSPRSLLTAPLHTVRETNSHLRDYSFKGRQHNKALPFIFYLSLSLPLSLLQLFILFHLFFSHYMYHCLPYAFPPQGSPSPTVTWDKPADDLDKPNEAQY